MPAEIEVLFVVGFGPIVKDLEANLELFRDTLGLPVSAGAEEPDYFTTSKVEGVKNFGMWPLHSAARSCFGRPEWPADRPAPNSWIEFDVADIEAATRTLKAKGYHLLVEAQQEPWGQTVTRFLSPDGVLVGVTLTPSLRN
jgi:catechol 2,3-dioxygenase-like lactoylglutathione lyase family enzyme